MNQYGEGLDPVPYIAAAYGLASFFFLGYWGWVIAERKKLKLIQQAVTTRRQT